MLNISGDRARRTVKSSHKVYYSQNYETAISDKITGWEGEQFPLIVLKNSNAKLSLPYITAKQFCCYLCHYKRLFYTKNNCQSVRNLFQSGAAEQGERGEHLLTLKIRRVSNQQNTHFAHPEQLNEKAEGAVSPPPTSIKTDLILPCFSVCFIYKF